MKAGPTKGKAGVNGMCEIPDQGLWDKHFKE